MRHHDNDRGMRRFAREPDGGHGPGHGHGPHSDDRHGRHRRHGSGRGGLGRFFEHGDLRLLVLHLIAERPRHGYEIIKAIEEQASGAYTPSPGVIYPTLSLLEETGMITVQADGARKTHAITEEGAAHLAANAPGLDAILARIAESGPGRGLAPQILRAMENLKLALRLRLSRGAPDETQLRLIAAAIDAAAVAVEQT
jgi:DNA-binding PadR family transcriptional regulator